MNAQPHTSRAHAKLAPSAAKRWMSCPASIRMSEGVPNITSVFAAEGTAAHELCAFALENKVHPSTFIDQWIDIRAKDGKIFVDLDEPPAEDHRFFPVTEEMADAVEIYVDHVNSLVAQAKGEVFLDVEQRLDMTHIHKEIYGTGDATVLDVEAKHLHVIDFKYGKGVAVDVEHNPQLLLYAAGAHRRHHNHDIKYLTVHVVQPRAEHRHGGVRAFQIDLIDLIEFEIEVQDKATVTEQEDAPFAAGDWCRFCPPLGFCPAARDRALSAVAEGHGEPGDPLVLTPIEQLTEERLGQILLNADEVMTYVKAVQQLAHDRASNGQVPDGFKLVAKRANRKWKDEGAVVDELALLGLSKADMLTEPKLRSPAQLERYFPGKNKDQRQKAMAELVKKESSGTNLVPLSDPRPAVDIGGNAVFSAVEGVE